MGDYKRRPSTAHRAAQPIPTAAAAEAGTDAISGLLQSASIHTQRLSFLRREEPHLHALRAIDPSDFLVLFTPAIPPSPEVSDTSKAQQQQAMDPFEPLGRALCRFHKRIRHVPYVPSIGITEIHRAFLETAGGLVVVLCEPTGSIRASEQGAGIVTKEQLGQQSAFANQVLHQLMEDDCEIPLLLITMACDVHRAGDMVRTHALEDFGNVLYSKDYTPSALRDVADRIFND